MTDDRCEFCGAALVAWRKKDDAKRYSCGSRSWWNDGCGAVITRTRWCRRAEIVRLAARVAALEAKPKRKPKAKGGRK